MSGPIVRSAPSKQFSVNWDAAFGGKSASRGKTGTKGKSGAKAAAKPTARKAARKKKKS
jgi:hypothetical protein